MKPQLVKSCKKIMAAKISINYYIGQYFYGLFASLPWFIILSSHTRLGILFTK